MEVTCMIATDAGAQTLKPFIFRMLEKVTKAITNVFCEMIWRASLQEVLNLMSVRIISI